MNWKKNNTGGMTLKKLSLDYSKALSFFKEDEVFEYDKKNYEFIYAPDEKA